MYCPVCNHSFHRWQHQRSWTVAQICALMQHYEFVTEWVGLVGFADVMPIRDFNQRKRLNEDWVWRHELPDGQVVPIIGGGDHIIYIGGTPSEELPFVEQPEPITTSVTPPVPLSLEDPDRLLADGLQRAQRLGTEPIVVVPSRAVGVRAQTMIVAEDLFGFDDGAGNTKRMLVFPGPFERLQRAVAEGRVPTPPVRWCSRTASGVVSGRARRRS